MVLVMPLKSGSRFDIGTALGAWLDNDDQQVSFQPSNPLQLITPKPDFKSTDCRDELLRLTSLRNGLVSDAFPKSHSHAAALHEVGYDDAHEYHAVLLQFEVRGFPTLPDDSNGLQLKWNAAYGPSSTTKSETHSHLLWDRCCITYNIVALLSYQASHCQVSNREDCKKGVGYCQQAASILETLQELVTSQDFATVDLSTAMLQFWKAFFLAQGQTFVYRMASLGGAANQNNKQTHHGTLSGLSQSAYLLWNDALSQAQEPRLQSEVPKPCQLWATYCKAQAMMAAARAEYHQAVLQRLDYKYGAEIVRLRQSLAKLQACQDFMASLKNNKNTFEEEENLVEYTNRECKVILPVVRDRLVEIERDNYKIYNEEIPKSVPDIPAKQLIKSSLGYPPTMLTPKGRPLFVGL